MKESGLNVIVALRTFLILILSACPGYSQDDKVQVEIEGNPPSENLIAAFDGAEADGLGWFRDVSEWKDVGFSFRSPAGGTFQTVTLRIQAVRADFQQESRFSIEVYETNGAGGENPLDGTLVYSGAGQLALQQKDIDMYLVFRLGKAVPLVAGNSYSVILKWEEIAPVVVLQANPSYTEGYIWLRTEGTDGKFVRVSESAQPGLTHFIQ